MSLVSMVENNPDPVKFKEAWEHPNPKLREGWILAIKKELMDMIENIVFHTSIYK